MQAELPDDIDVSFEFDQSPVRDAGHSEPGVPKGRSAPC